MQAYEGIDYFKYYNFELVINSLKAQHQVLRKLLENSISTIK